MARKGLFSQTFTLPNGKRKYVTAKTRQELEEKVFQLKLQLRLGVDLDDKTTVGELIQMWFEAEQRGRIRDTTEKTVRSLVNTHILPQLSGLPVRDVTPLVIQNYMSTLTDLNLGSGRRCLSILRSAFSIAVENGLISKSPVLDRFKVRGKANTPKRALSWEQQEQLLSALESKSEKHPMLHLFVLLALMTGLRRGEIYALMWDSVDLDAQLIHVRRSAVFQFGGVAQVREELKTSHSYRSVPIPDRLLRVLRQHRTQSNSMFLFPDPKDPGQIHFSLERRVSAWLNYHTGPDAIAKHPVLEDIKVTPHTLRHSYATRLFEAGLDIKEIQTLLGHSSPDITLKIYVDYCEARKADTFGKVRNALDGRTTSVPHKSESAG